MKFLLFASLSLVVAAHAQPDINNAPKADNPVNRPVRAIGGANQTPAQRSRQRLRRQFQQVGATSPLIQDALLDYVESESQARTALAEKARALQSALRADAQSDAQIAALLTDYQSALRADRARQEVAATALSKKIDLAKAPKIEATLALMGVYGGGPTFLLGGALGTGGLGRDNALNGGNGNVFGVPNTARGNRGGNNANRENGFGANGFGGGNVFGGNGFGANVPPATKTNP